MLLLRGSSHDVEQKIHTRAREKEHEAVLRSMNMKKDLPHSFTGRASRRQRRKALWVQFRNVVNQQRYMKDWAILDIVSRVYTGRSSKIITQRTNVLKNIENI